MTRSISIVLIALFAVAACGRVDPKRPNRPEPHSTNNGTTDDGTNNSTDPGTHSGTNFGNNGTEPEYECGNGVLEPGELCDPAITEGVGACPTSCSAAACSTVQIVGSAATCDARCVQAPVSCVNDDGCCPAGCDASTDSDCDNMCGDLVVEAPETCDGNCPTSCNDGNACTTDQLLGSAATCDVTCQFSPVTACINGDGCCPSGCNHTNDNDCACVARTCTQAGASCGTVSDGCGGTITCANQCGSNQTCENNQCVTTTQPTQQLIGTPCMDYPECGNDPNTACVLPPQWPGGYCSLICNDAACPSGSACAPLNQNDDVCMKTCTSDNNCRSGYECTLHGGHRVCMPPVGDGGIGSPCSSNQDCNSGLCDTLLLMCTETCSIGSCPSGYSCSLLFQQCAPACSTDADCPGTAVCLVELFIGHCVGIAG